MSTVYTRDNCVQCTRTKAALKKRGLESEEIEVDDETADSFREQGYQSLPIVIARGETWAGFRPDKIKEIPA